MKEEGLVKRIGELMDYSGCHSKKEFANKIGFDASNFSQIMLGRRSVPRSLLNRISEVFPEVDKAWLYDGEGSQIKIHANDIPGFGNDEERAEYKPRLPITAAAGTLSDYLGGVLAHECDYLPKLRSIPEYDFTMIVKGNSMEPKFEGGDEIACKKVEKIIEWGKTYVLATRDGAVLKRLYQDEDGVRCVSYNHEEYPDFHVDGDDILGVYRVVGLLRV